MKFIIKSDVNKLSWLWLAFSVLPELHSFSRRISMNCLKINEIHIEYSDGNEEALLYF